MYFSPLLISCGALLGGLVAVVKNNCPHSIVAGTSENGNEYGSSNSISAGGSHTYNYPAPWEGRVWARKSCQGKTCNFSGMWAPTSLAEFHFYDGDQEDFYDISFVDGWNLPLSISPNTKSENSYNVDRHCGSPKVSSLPSCPAGFETDDGACASACSHFRTPEYCCTGSSGSANTCKGSSYASKVKAQAPDAYSYAFDDDTSVYTCNSNGYTVTFCP